jgi:flagellar hook-basal body protein
MSFYTALTGLNAATTQLSVTSNNIANVNTTGFKRSRADFGDIFAISPLQKASSVAGQGVALKSVTQEFSQGNVAFSANSLDVAITGDGFFPLKSADGLQDIYTRTGNFQLDDSFTVVNTAGQSLMAAPVDSSGKADLTALKKLTIPRSTTGDAAETTAIDLGVNLPADAQVVDPNLFNPKDPSTYNLTTTVSVYDAGGNEYQATVYYLKTQRASSLDPSNKWQTHVYIGDTSLDEYLTQAQDPTGELLFVNKYGQVQPESAIPPQLIARGVTKLINLDTLNVKSASSPAALNGGALGGTATTALKTGTYNPGDIIADSEDKEIAFYLNVDNSPTPTKVDLSDLLDNVGVSKDFNGNDLAQYLENKINKAYGDQRYFDLSDYTDNSGLANLFTLRFTPASGNGEVMDPLNVHVDLTGNDVTSVTTEQLQAAINEALTGSGEALGLNDDLLVQYDPVGQNFAFNTAGLAGTLEIEGYAGGYNQLFGLSNSFREIDNESGLYGSVVIPNGETLRSYNSNYNLSDQRYGIKVSFDDTKGLFTILSGTTGDASAIEIVDPEETIVGGVTTPSNYFANFNAIFKIDKGETSTESTATRGVRSSPAVITGNSIGQGLAGSFQLSADTSKFTVTVDNVTGLVALPTDVTYTKETFRQALENGINSLEDASGSTVNGVKVAYSSNASNLICLTFTSGTEGDDSFLKVTGPSIWGLTGLESAKGLTEQWCSPVQAVNKDNVQLYVDRNGNETTSPAGYNDTLTQNLWSPVYLDKGELTFSANGSLVSPLLAVGFKPTTIGDTGTTLSFSINYEGSTQFSSPFSVIAQSQNGRPEGDLMGLNIGDDGLVSANYSNGNQKNLGKIILANFTAPTGLRQLGDSSFLATSASGTATLGEAGTAGFGTVRAGALERSNVDLTQELIDLITAQRNFQANAKAIETNNTLTQTIINVRN